MAYAVSGGALNSTQSKQILSAHNNSTHKVLLNSQLIAIYYAMKIHN